MGLWLFKNNNENLQEDDDLESIEYNHDYIQYIHAICDLSTLCLYACIDYEQAILLLFCIDFFRWRESQVRKVVNVMIKQRQAFYTQVEICLSL